MTVKIELTDALSLSQSEIGKVVSMLTALCPGVSAISEFRVEQLTAETDKAVSHPVHRIEHDVPQPVGQSYEDVSDEVDKQEQDARPDDSEILDNAGYAWDERIHSRHRTKTTDGLWRLKRNLDPTFLEFVRSGSPSRRPSFIPSPPAPIITETVEAPTIPAAKEFGELVKKLTKYQNDNLISITQINGLLTQLGLKTIVDLSKKPELFSAVDAMLDHLAAEDE